MYLDFCPKLHPAAAEKAPLYEEGGQIAEGNPGGDDFSSSPRPRFARPAPLGRGGLCGRPMVAPTFIAGTAIESVGAGIARPQGQ